ncbi:MAG: hypothetical protein H0V11_08050 [Actinobacteria bacterium]|nr:hypothetical protein [Actinomycetota bacterium]
MGFLRREEPLHEKLAREGGLDFPQSTQDLAGPLDPRHPFQQVAGIHGVPRPREWDAVASADAPGVPGDELEFVVLDDGTLIVDDDVADGALTPLADALEISIAPPYHAYARRRGQDVWAAAAFVVDVVEVPEELSGDTVSIAVQDGLRTTLVGDQRYNDRIQSLEHFAEADFEAYVLEATRLDGPLWEVTVNPL